MEHYYILKAYDQPGESHVVTLDDAAISITCNTRELSQVDIAAVMFIHGTGVTKMEYDGSGLVVMD